MLTEGRDSLYDFDAGLVNRRDVDLVFEGNSREDFGDGGSRLCGDFLSFAKSKDGRAGSADAETKSSGGHGRSLCFVELGDELLAARLGDDVVDGATDESVVGLNESADESAKVTDLCSGVGEGDFCG